MAGPLRFPIVLLGVSCALFLSAFPSVASEPQEAAPHDHEYVGSLDCETLAQANDLECPYLCNLDVKPLGAVCIPPGHLGQDINGNAWIRLRDYVDSPVAGYACQDLDHDLICGGADELEWTFCHYLLLEWQHRWNLNQGIMVVPYGPISGAGIHLQKVYENRCAPGTGVLHFDTVSGWHGELEHS